MSIYLSKTEITSYCGNVVPLKLIADHDISCDSIKWQSDSDHIKIRDFSKSKDYAFNNGVLLTLSKEGCTKVICEHDGKKYECKVSISKRRHATRDDKMNVYPADLHIHTSKEHKRDIFAAREVDFPSDCIASAKDSGAIECSVLTDHACTLNDRDFFRGFTDEEETPHSGLVVFPGAESEITVIEKDRFGLSHKNSGESVTINASNYSNAHSWDEHFANMADSEFVVAGLAHPCVVGWDKNGIWNYSLYKNSQNPEFKRIMRLTETGRGDYSQSSMLYHYVYSQALDCGLKISPCSTSDSHGSYEPVIGKTFIVSPEKSKEMFYDALVSNRIYACDSGAVELKMSVNGCIMGEIMPITDTYKFHIEASVIKNVENAMPVNCTVVSDYGKKLLTVPFDGSADFEIKSDSARYFYVLLTDSEARKTWSSPVWTGREFDDFSHIEKLKPIDKNGWTAFDEITSSDASAVINDNPKDVWGGKAETASIIIDMKEEKQIAAVGHYAPPVFRFELMEADIPIESVVTEFACEYKISTSCDGKEYEEAKSGYIRAFGGEDVLAFEPKAARYVRFEVLSTVGADSERKEFEGKKVKIGELSIFE